MLRTMLSPESVLDCISLLVSAIAFVCIHRVIKKSNSIIVITITKSYCNTFNYKNKTGTYYLYFFKKMPKLNYYLDSIILVLLFMLRLFINR